MVQAEDAYEPQSGVVVVGVDIASLERIDVDYPPVHRVGLAHEVLPMTRILVLEMVVVLVMVVVVVGVEAGWMRV